MLLATYAAVLSWPNRSGKGWQIPLSAACPRRSEGSVCQDLSSTKFTKCQNVTWQVMTGERYWVIWVLSDPRHSSRKFTSAALQVSIENGLPKSTRRLYLMDIHLKEFTRLFRSLAFVHLPFASKCRNLSRRTEAKLVTASHMQPQLLRSILALRWVFGTGKTTMAGWASGSRSSSNHRWSVAKIIESFPYVQTHACTYYAYTQEHTRARMQVGMQEQTHPTHIQHKWFVTRQSVKRTVLTYCLCQAKAHRTARWVGVSPPSTLFFSTSWQVQHSKPTAFNAHKCLQWF